MGLVSGKTGCLSLCEDLFPLLASRRLKASLLFKLLGNVFSTVSAHTFVFLSIFTGLLRSLRVFLRLLIDLVAMVQRVVCHVDLAL